MKQEDKQLILIEIATRVPYGIKVQQSARYAPDRRHSGPDTLPHDYTIVGVDDYGRLYYRVFMSDNLEFIPIENCVGQVCRPYLRSMSSMTEEEKKEYKHLVAFSGSSYGAANFIDWLNAHHFDYRDLIPKGLALEMPKDMYPKTIITEDEGLNELKELFPIGLLEPKELEVALTLYKNSPMKALKYIREKHPELGLKEAKIYYDLYINNKEN